MPNLNMKTEHHPAVIKTAWKRIKRPSKTTINNLKKPTMNTEVKLNKYWEKSPLIQQGLGAAGELLHLMRPEVEEILKVRRGDAGPPSQSLRAQGVITGINFRLSDEDLSIEEKMKLFNQRNILEDFLAVHRTVWILEGKPL